MGNKRYKVFISSVQSEFEQERTALVEFFQSDVLLKSFFEPFVFERHPADSVRPEIVFVSEVEKSDIYIVLLGINYGHEGDNGISATEKEYDTAKRKGIVRWVYILNTTAERHPKENKLIQKVSDDVSWKFFTTVDELKKEVFHTCFEFLKLKGKIENSDFDNSLHPYAVTGDINKQLLNDFILLARQKRNFAEKPDAPVENVLKRLNLLRDNKIVNSALLCFSDNPQQYFPTATVKCTYFHGYVVQKPIPDYKEYGGTIFEMAEHAVDFILSKISLSTGTRDRGNLVATEYEIPRAVVAEAVINALAHRDYQSKGSVQVSVFKNRIEIENPGHLPEEISLEDLKLPHASYPANPLLANCLFLAGAIERYGTGTLEIIAQTVSKGLPEPTFSSYKTFKVILPRKVLDAKAEVDIAQNGTNNMRDIYGINSEQIRNKFGINVLRTLELIMEKPEMTAMDMATKLNLNSRTVENYLAKLKESGYLERQGSKKDGRWIIIKKED